MLTLFDQLYLLALNEEKGNLIASTRKTFAFAYSGAVLDELALLNRICLNEKSRIEVIASTKTGDEVLDEALKEIADSDKLRKPAYWVGEFVVQPKRLRERLGDRLAAKGILNREDNRFFRAQSSPQEIPSKFEMKHQLRGMILLGTQSNPSSLALLTMLDAANLLHLIFTPDELDMVQKDIHERVLRCSLEKPTFQFIEEIAQAVETLIEDDNN